MHQDKVRVVVEDADTKVGIRIYTELPQGGQGDGYACVVANHGVPVGDGFAVDLHTSATGIESSAHRQAIQFCRGSTLANSKSVFG